MKLIVGLGNMGEEYQGTRHNAGFEVVDRLAKSEQAGWKKDLKRFCQKTEILHRGEKIILAKPTTYMNLSGKAVSALATFYKIRPQDILVIQDELDLEPGCLTFSKMGRSGGHHGIESIQELMPNPEISRLRIGIGKPNRSQEPDREMKDWVLSRPKGKERESLDSAFDDAAEAAMDWAEQGLDSSMNKWNFRKKIAS